MVISTGAKQAILSTVPRGGTALYNGTYLTLKELAKERRANGEVRRQAIVVLSDGDDTASLVSYDDLMDLAKQSGHRDLHDHAAVAVPREAGGVARALVLLTSRSSG